MDSRRDARRRAVRTHSTYIIEAMVMLACVVTIAALAMAVFSYAARTTAHADRQQQAIVLATNAAERFAADPEAAYADGAALQQGVGDYQAECVTSASPTAAGCMYTAEITVSYGEEQLWVLETSRYVSSREGGRS